MTVEQTLLAHGVVATAERLAPGQYRWEARCCTRAGGGVLCLTDGESLAGATPEALGASCLERLAGVAWVVEAHLATGRPPWIKPRKWAALCDAAEALRRAVSPEAYAALVEMDE